MEKSIESIETQNISSRLLSGELLGKYCQFGAGGTAKYLFIAENLEDLIEAVLYAQKNHLPYHVIGTGGGLLFSDDGFDGLVIVNRSSRINAIVGENVVVCDSGVSINSLISYTAGRGLSGLEALAGVGGSVGGSIYSNACAGATCLSNCLRCVTMLSHKGKIVRRSAQWLELAPRTSKLHNFHKLAPWVILAANFRLYRRRAEDIREDMRLARARSGRLADNGVIAQVLISPDSDQDAPELIRRAGMGSAREGRAEIMRHDCDSLRNGGSATSSDARRLIEKVIGGVAEKENIKLKETISYLGTWR